MTKKDKDLIDEIKPHPEHPIFTWSWYALPSPLVGYLVLPSHVPFPGEPIDFEGNVPTPHLPTDAEVEENS